MRLMSASAEEFSKYIIEEKKKIVVFGAGTICKTYIPYIDELYHFSEYIIFIVDNNLAKHGQRVNINGNLVEIKSLSAIDNISDDFCILITNSEFYSALEQLNCIEKCKKQMCFIVPMMQMDRRNLYSQSREYHSTEEAIIPKTIHYCWFSGKDMPDDLKRCVDSWRKMCPDYEIIRWDESNYDLSKFKYSFEAFQNQKWGFIPDVVRLDLLYNYGGFYFDTDVEIIKNLDSLRFQKAFCGRERFGHVNFGSGSGACPHSEVIEELLDFRKNESFVLENGLLNLEASGYYETLPLMRRGMILEDICQELDGINVYSSDFFAPYNFSDGSNIKNDNTYAIHYFNASWIAGGDQLRKRTREKYSKIREALEKLR